MDKSDAKPTQGYSVMFKIGLIIWLGGNISAWFALIGGDYIGALVAGMFAFAIWLMTLDIIELLKD